MKKRKNSGYQLKVLTLGFGVIVLVILSLLFYMLSSASLGLSELSVFSVLIVIIILATFLVLKRAKAYKTGLPFEDELAKKVQWKAGYYTFLITIYVALGTAWYADSLEEAGIPLPARYVAYIILLASAILYFMFYLYLSRKGDV